MSVHLRYTCTFEQSVRQPHPKWIEYKKRYVKIVKLD